MYYPHLTPHTSIIYSGILGEIHHLAIIMMVLRIRLMERKEAPRKPALELRYPVCQSPAMSEGESG